MLYINYNTYIHEVIRLGLNINLMIGYRCNTINDISLGFNITFGADIIFVCPWLIDEYIYNE